MPIQRQWPPMEAVASFRSADARDGAIFYEDFRGIYTSLSGVAS
jgi:hypothetical protein